jgi:energy-coupling factor transporter ATP-binding protein EcfA2
VTEPLVVLRLERIRKTFGGLLVLADVDLSVEEGQIVGLIGPNGAGKSTLFNVITSVHQPDALAFSRRDRERLTDFYASKKMRWSYHGEALVRYFKTGKMKKPCTCGYSYFSVRHNGELFPCPLVNRSVGNVKERPVERLFLSEEAAQLRRRTGAHPECRACTEPGLERYALPYEGFSYLSLLCRLGKKRFLQLHVDMGLNKYF